MALAGAGSADEDGVALLGKEVAGCQLANERLVDGRAVEAEVVDILGQRQFAMVSWYLIDCACFSAISALSRSPTAAHIGA
jgi:hypothetical protein